MESHGNIVANEYAQKKMKRSLIEEVDTEHCKINMDRCDHKNSNQN